jgi:hypothetical protein
MADETPAYIGVEPCGCVTAVQVDDGSHPKDIASFLSEVVKSGRTIERTTVGEAKAREHFLPWECPHDPKGWKSTPYVDPADRVTVSQRSYIGASTVRKGHRRVGQVRREHQRSGSWFATRGWFTRDGTASDGREARELVEVAGPFRTRTEAVAHLTLPERETV